MDKENKGFWNKWAKRYDAAMSGSGNIYDFIAREAKKTLTRDMTVLELACGTGLLSLRLAGSVKILEATDFSEDMIREAKRKARSSRLHFSVQDATKLPYAPGTFDAVFISNALHIMPRPEQALSEIARVLKPDGILIAPTFTMSDSFAGRARMRLMELSGFHVFHKWTSDAFLVYLGEHGFTVTKSSTIGKSAKLTYAEAKIKERVKNGKNHIEN